MKRIVNLSGKLNWGKRAYVPFILCAVTAVALPAQTFATLYSFDSLYGEYSAGSLVQATDGNLYGTTYGGANGYGTIFKITPAGTLTTLYSFCPQMPCVDGGEPVAGLVQATDGDFYGTTSGGGLNSWGTVFKITSNGTLTTLYNFCSQARCADGAGSQAGLVQAGDGQFYGTTVSGGANGDGTVFAITPNGTLASLYSFCSEGKLCTDGANPYAGLVQAPGGDFYGTTLHGGGGDGTIFKITPSGTLKTLFDYVQTGASFYAGLVQAANGDFYGTTYDGGRHGFGMVYKMTPGGRLTALYSFCGLRGCGDGEAPQAGLIQATDGNLYGTTSLGGAGGYGTIFRITPAGELTTLYSFCSQSECTDGGLPIAALVQATNGDFYGTTSYRGSSDGCEEPCGTVFRLSVGMGPFVETQPTSGKVGESVKILATNLTGVSSVTFNGTPAVFGVSPGSETELTTSVPAGATSGSVQVITPSGTLSSDVSFRVSP